MNSASRSSLREAQLNGNITLKEWQGWGCISPVPSMGDFKVQEDKKHRAKYQALDDSKNNFQFFSARKIACRLLGSWGYLCQKCWLPMEDCMCSKVKPCSLWHGIRFWLYLHPKDFLRQNNTGKLLCEQTRALLTSAAYVQLKHADVSKYTRNLSPASQSIFL